MAKSNSLFRTKWIRGLVVGGVATAIGVVLLLTGAVQGPEQTTWDLRVRLMAGPSSATNDVVVVHLDQSDIDQLRADFGLEWPWPRSIYSYISEFARVAGAASLTFDIIFEDPGVGVPDDQIFQSASADFGRTVFGAEFFGVVAEEDTALAEPWPSWISLPELTVDSAGSRIATGESFLQASFPHQDVIPPNAVLGFVNQDNDDDGVFRRYRLVNYHLDKPVPALGIAQLLVDGGSAELTFESGTANYRGREIPVGNDGKVLLRYTSRWAFPTEEERASDPAERNSFFARELILSAADLIAGGEPSIPPEALRGRHLLVGFSASGLLDLRPTPLEPRAPGVIVHATMLDNLLSERFMQDFPVWASIVLLLILAVGAAELASLTENTVVAVLLFLAFVALTVGVAVGGYALGFWVEFIAPLIAVVIALAGANVANFATEGAQRRQIRGMFGRYLSPAVIARLEANPENLELGGEEREISIYFSDIQKFSTISKDLGDAKKLTSFINAYLTPMTDIILEEGGTIDKYEGDAIIAFWGAPVEQPDHAERALRAVMRCQQKLAELRPEFQEQIGKEVHQRIGLNTGVATVGNMGSQQRFDYTMIGDAVNLAARLEGANKAFGTYTMVSKETLDETDNLYPVRETGNIGVVGREDKPVRIYEPMQPEEYQARAGALEIYQQALALFYKGEFAQAKALFQRISDADPVAASYIPRCDTLLSNPPAAWNGVWVLTEKG